MRLAGPQSEYSWPLPEYQSKGNSAYPCDLPTKAELCDACSMATSLVQSSDLPYSRMRPFGAKWSAIKSNSLERACGICCILVQSMTPSLRSRISDEVDIFRFWDFSSGDKRITLRFSIGYEAISIPFTPIEDFKGLNLGIQPSRSNNSPTSIEVSRRWLRECTGNHPRCANNPASGSTPFVPTRLIHLGDAEEIVQPRLTLPTAAGTSLGIRYCTLSHCWGPDPSRILQLTKKSLEGMQEQIPIAQLSPVFREAMEAAKRLDFHYIWIDSLCILQDDRHDWRIEAARMGDIYANSGLTLAATKSANGEGGCWSMRHVFDVIPCRVDLLHESEDLSGPQKFICYSPSLWSTSILRSHLLSRGWVTQEIFLSRRVLHFAQDQLFWECDIVRANETFPHGIPGADKKKGVTLHHDILTDAGDQTTLKYRAWDDAVSTFSRANLTNPREDKLVALASIATKLEIDDQLIAGLWQKRLPEQLLWERADRDLGVEDDSLVYQAPSWSWASLNAAVSPCCPSKQGSQTIVHLTVNEIMVMHEGNDSRAPIISGYLDVQAPLSRIPLHRAVGKTGPESFHSTSCPRIHGYIRVDRKCTLTSLHLLWVREIKGHPGLTLQGIALFPVEGREGCYKRVGCFYSDFRKEEDPYAAFRHARESENISNRGVSGSLADGVPRYSVRLI